MLHFRDQFLNFEAQYSKALIVVWDLMFPMRFRYLFLI